MAAKRVGLVMCLVLDVAILRAQNTDHVKVIVAKANVRSEPKDTAPVLTQAAIGATFELRGVEGDWFRVTLYMGGMRAEAFISKKVAKIEPAPPGGAATAAAIPTPPTAPAGTPPPASAASAPIPPAPPSPAFAEGLSVVLQTAAGAGWLTPHHAAVSASPDATGGATVTWTWTVEGAASLQAVSDRRPTFVVLYRDIPGVSADGLAPALVRLAPAASGGRVVAAARGRADASSRRNADWDLEKEFIQDSVRVELVPAEPGSAKVRPAADLAPGDYAVVVRPIVMKKLAGATVLSEAGAGRVFGVVFDFTIR